MILDLAIGLLLAPANALDRAAAYLREAELEVAKIASATDRSNAMW